MHEKKLLAPVILVLVITGVAICYFYVSNFTTQEKYPITIAVSKTPLSAPFYVANAINAFENTCASVEVDEVIGGQAAFEKVMNGKVDFGTSSDSVIAFQSLSSQEFVTHAMFVQSDNDVKLITRTADKIELMSDLKGKKIGVTKGTSSEYILSTLLAIEGLSMNDVELHHYKPEKLLVGFSQQEVDAILPWEPFGFQALQLLNEKIKIHDTKSLSTLSFNLISQPADKELLEKAKCVIEGLRIAIDYIVSNPEAAKKIVIAELDVDPEFIAWVWSDYIFKLGLNHSLMLNIKSQAIWAMESQFGEFEHVHNTERIVDSRALSMVSPGSVNLSM